MQRMYSNIARNLLFRAYSQKTLLSEKQISAVAKHFTKALEATPFGEDENIQYHFNKSFAILAISPSIFHRQASEHLDSAYNLTINNGQLDKLGDAINYGYKKLVTGESSNKNYYINDAGDIKKVFAEVSELIIEDAHDTELRLKSP